MMTGRYPWRFGVEYTPTPGAMALVAGELYPYQPPPLIDRPAARSAKRYNELGMPASEHTMAEALKAHLPAISHTMPTGGFYLWLSLPEELDSKEMLPRAITELVAYTPGTAFFANGHGRSNIRLAFCYPEPAFITEGVRRLSRVIAEELELAATFGPRTTDVQASSRGDGPPPDVA
jgi:hypothetical protein